MSNFQKELPNSRINITLDLDTKNGKKSVELPFHALVLGDLSNQTNHSNALGERAKFKINKHNFNSILEDVSPKTEFTVPNVIKNDKSSLEINLEFKHIKDFEPQRIAEKIPELQKLLGMRNLLKDLKSQIRDNPKLRHVLEKNLIEATEIKEV
ncbi:MAG: type VI secretion system contractile sheath small subunit [Gammaproteobacteria bacterium]